MSAPLFEPTGSESGGGDSGGRRFSLWRAAVLSLALIMFAVSTVAAFRQRVHPDAHRYVERPRWNWLAHPRESLDEASNWFAYPIERNAFKRLPYVSGEINDIFHLPDTEHVWAVGDGGLILHSPDLGLSWEKLDPPAQVPADQRDPIDFDQFRPETTSDGDVKSGPILLDGPEIKPSGTENNPSIDESKPTTKAAEPPAKQGTPSMNPSQPLMNQSSPPEESKQPPPDPKSPSSSPKGGSSESAPPTVDPSGDPAAPQWGIAPQLASALASTVLGQETEVTIIRPRLPNDFSRVFFIDATRGWLLSEIPDLFKTEDGGKTWQYLTTLSETPAQLLFLDPDRGFLSISGLILKTEDAGSSWSLAVSNVDAQAVFVGAASGRAWAIIVTDTGPLEAQVYWMAEDGATGPPRSLPRLDGVAGFGFLSDQLGWLVEQTEVMEVYWTRDGGSTWSAEGQADVQGYMTFCDVENGFAVSFDGELSRTHDSGRTWTRTARKANIADGGCFLLGTPSSVRFCETDYYFSPLFTQDCGSTWSPVFQSITAASLDGAGNAVVVTNSAEVFRSRNAGQTYSRVVPGYDKEVETVAVNGPERLWVTSSDSVGDAISAFKNDRGKPAEEVRFSIADGSFRGTGLIDVAFSAAETGVALFYSHMSAQIGVVGRTLDGGRSWTITSEAAEVALRSISIQDDDRIWGTTWESRAMWSTDGGNTWAAPKIDNLIPDETIVAIDFANKDVGWILTKDGSALLVTTDEAKTWTRHPISKTEPGWTGKIPLVEMKCISPTGGYLVLPWEVYYTRDTGKTWEARTLPYRRYPAPWYYLSLVLSAGLVALALVPSRQIAHIRRWIADEAVSDAPLQPGEKDALRLGEMARGMGYFLSSPNTMAPLTIAVTGAWGSGKSSLMNLLQHELKRAQSCTVWFNAWHHQTEQHLLASLLETIRTHATPSVLRWRGLRFRVRLMGRRLYEWLTAHPFKVLGVLAILAGSIFVIDRWKDQPRAAATAATSKPVEYRVSVAGRPLPSISIESSGGNGAEADSDYPGLLLGGVLGIPGWLQALGASATGLITLFEFLRRSIRSFGVDPAKFASAVAGAAKPKDLKAQTSFRHQFAKEFNDVTWALGPRRKLVIFVDDLDRCTPANVVEVLQAINFLVTAGRCVIVMGADRNYVQTCINLEYEKMIKQMQADRETTQAEGGKAWKRRTIPLVRYLAPTTRSKMGGTSPSSDPTSPPIQSNGRQPDGADEKPFAIAYLQKLINIEVPIPKMGHRETADMLPPPPPKTEESEAERRKKAREKRKAARRKWLKDRLNELPVAAEPVVGMALWAAILGVLMWGAYAALPISKVGDALAKAATSTTPAPEPATKPPPGGPGTAPPVQSPVGPPAEEPRPPARFIAGDAVAHAYSGFAIASIVGILMLGASFAGLSRLQLQMTEDSPKFTIALQEWLPLIKRGGPTPREVKRYLNRVRYHAMRQRGAAEPLPWWTQLRRGLFGLDGQVHGQVSMDVEEEDLVGLGAIDEFKPGWIDELETSPKTFFDAHDAELKDVLGPEKSTTYRNRWIGNAQIVPRYKSLSRGLTTN